MDDDREQELEQRVDELEATVRGLTEELVDLSERTRHLESETDLDTQPNHTSALPDEADATDEPADDVTEEVPDESESESEDADDIIVA